MNTALPLVTIITPAYNRASFLEETIQSVLSQDYPHIEYIILDDGSTDNTREVLGNYNGRIYWESHPNMGETRTVNKGFAMAKGEIVCVVNSDDPLLPGAISAAVKVMQQCPEALAAYPDWIEIGPNSECVKELRLPDYDLFNMLTTFNVAIGPGTFIRRNAFGLVGMRDPQLTYTGDLEFWFRLVLHGKLAHIPVTLATHRTHPESASVTDKGPRMADELVSLAERIYAHHDLAPEILKKRARVFCTAHFVAACYCGSNRSAAITHHLAAIRYDPWGYIRAVAMYFGARTNLAILSAVYGFHKPVFLRNTSSLPHASSGVAAAQLNDQRATLPSSLRIPSIKIGSGVTGVDDRSA